jgi:hypothetical protein
MNIRKIHGFFVPGRIPLILLIFIFIFIRIFDAEDKDSLELWGLIAMQIAIAFLLLYLNHTFIAIRNRSLLPVFFYLLFTGSNSMFYSTWTSGISLLCVLLFFLLLFSSLMQFYPQGNAFNIAFILTLGSFAWQPLLFFFPILWGGMLNFHELNFRSFFATLAGFAVIYLFIFTGSIYLENNPDIFMDKLPDFQTLFQFRFLEGFTLQEYFIFGFLFFLFIIAGANIFMWNISENAKTITALRFLYVITFILFVILFLQSQWKKEWASILSLPLSLLISHLFSNPYNRSVIRLMLLTIVFFLGMFLLAD